MPYTHALATNQFGCAAFIVDATAANGSHTTIASALSQAVSGQTIFIKPGTYTENLTLVAGVSLTAFECDSSLNTISNVTIFGTCTLTAAGTVTISGIQLKTNSAALLAVTGSAASIVNLNNCYLNMTNNTGITFSTSNSSGRVAISNSRGDLGTTGIAVFSHSSTGNISMILTVISNSGVSSTASTCSAGSVSLLNTYLSNPITLSGTGSITMKYSEIDTSATNSTSLTTVTGQTHNLDFVRLASGSATPLSVGGTVVSGALELTHTNTSATTGAGNLLYNSIFQTTTVGALSTTTLTPKGHIGMQNSTSPAAGYIGEEISATVTNGSPVALVNATAKTITSIVLTPGIWDISSIGGFSGYTTATQAISAISANNNSLTGTLAGNSRIDFPVSTAANSDSMLSIPAFRVSLSAATTTYYLIAQLAYTVGSGTGFGTIRAKRVA